MAEKRGFFGSIKDALVRGGVFGNNAKIELLRNDYRKYGEGSKGLFSLPADDALFMALNEIKNPLERCNAFVEIDTPHAAVYVTNFGLNKSIKKLTDEERVWIALEALSRMKNGEAPNGILKITKAYPAQEENAVFFLSKMAKTPDEKASDLYQVMGQLLYLAKDSSSHHKLFESFQANLQDNNAYLQLMFWAKADGFKYRQQALQLLVDHVTPARVESLNGFIRLLPDHKGSVLEMLQNKNTDAAMQVVAQSYLKDQRYSAAAMNILVQNGGAVAMGLAKDHLIEAPKDMLERAQSLSGVNVSKPEPKARVEALISGVAHEISKGSASPRFGNVGPLMDQFSNIAQQKGLDPVVMQGFNAAALTYMLEWRAKGSPPAPEQL